MFNAQQIATDTIANGGATVDILGNRPNAGFAVAGYPANGLIVPISQFSPETVGEYVAAHLEILARPNHYLGTWFDAGRVYLDISIVETDRATAIETARNRDQIAIFDLSTFETITV